MEEPAQSEAQPHEFQEVKIEEVGGQHIALEDLRVVKLRVTADLGNARMLVRAVLELKVGSVVTLDKMAGEMTDVFVNGLPLAKGEIVVIGDALHVRIIEISGVGNLPDGAGHED